MMFQIIKHILEGTPSCKLVYKNHQTPSNYRPSTKPIQPSYKPPITNQHLVDLDLMKEPKTKTYPLYIPPKWCMSHWENHGRINNPEAADMSK